MAEVVDINDIQMLLDQGKDPKEIFAYVEDENENNILCVCLGDKMWNFLKVPENKLVCSDWYRLTLPFSEGFGIVRRNDDRWNFVKPDGSMLCSDWYEYVTDFNDGFGIVKRSSDCKYNFVKPDGRLLSNKWYLRIIEFKDGFAKVLTDDGWRYIGTTGKMVD